MLDTRFTVVERTVPRYMVAAAKCVFWIRVNKKTNSFVKLFKKICKEFALSWLLRLHSVFVLEPLTTSGKQLYIPTFHHRTVQTATGKLQ